MTEDAGTNRTFLLRLWQARSGGQIVWRASLEDAHTRARRGFADIESLAQFLQGQFSAERQAEPPSEQPDDFSTKLF